LKLRAEIAQKEADIYRQSQTTLQEVREEQQECLASHKEISSTWSTKEKQRLNSDRQRLERTMDHLKLDKEHMEAENKELSNEILQKTEEFQTRKEELMLQRGFLQVKSTHLNNYMIHQTRKTVFDHICKLFEVRQNTPLRIVFSTLFSVFGNMVKHSLSFLMYYFSIPTVLLAGRNFSIRSKACQVKRGRNGVYERHKRGRKQD